MTPRIKTVTYQSSVWNWELVTLEAWKVSSYNENLFEQGPLQNSATYFVEIDFVLNLYFK